VQIGLALTTAGLLLFALLPLDWVDFYASGMLVGFGMSALLGAPLRYIVLQEAGEGRRGAGQGVLALCVSVGQLVGAAAIGGIVGSAADAVPGYRQSLLTVAAVCGIALVLSAALRGRVSARREPRSGS
jgi:MFS family permease